MYNSDSEIEFEDYMKPRTINSTIAVPKPVPTTATTAITATATTAIATTTAAAAATTTTADEKQSAFGDSGSLAFEYNQMRQSIAADGEANNSNSTTITTTIATTTTTTNSSSTSTSIITTTTSTTAITNTSTSNTNNIVISSNSNSKNSTERTLIDSLPLQRHSVNGGLRRQSSLVEALSSSLSTTVQPVRQFSLSSDYSELQSSVFEHSFFEPLSPSSKTATVVQLTADAKRLPLAAPESTTDVVVSRQHEDRLPVSSDSAVSHPSTAATTTATTASATTKATTPTTTTAAAKVLNIEKKGMFGSLTKFAGDALKGAKQATEQLAHAAQHAASTGDLTAIKVIF